MGGGRGGYGPGPWGGGGIGIGIGTEPGEGEAAGVLLIHGVAERDVRWEAVQQRAVRVKHYGDGLGCHRAAARGHPQRTLFAVRSGLLPVLVVAI